MIQQEMYDVAEVGNSKFPSFVQRRVFDLVRLCDRAHQGEFYLGLVRLVRPYSIFMTGV